MNDLKEPADKPLVEPIHVTIPVGCQITGDSRTSMYDAIKSGDVEAVKSGRRTLLVFESLKRRCAQRPRAELKPLSDADEGHQRWRAELAEQNTRRHRRKRRGA